MGAGPSGGSPRTPERQTGCNGRRRDRSGLHTTSAKEVISRMLRSMFSSVVGLRAMQTRMDVIGDNIANVNTPGFKASRVTFSDLFAETLRGASAPGGTTGGANPMQIGLGTNLASIDQVMTAGTMQLTGRNTDMAIQGGGFFVVTKGAERFFTRSGAFSRDVVGYLTTPSSGLRLQGWMADAAGNFPVKDMVNLQDVRISTGEVQLATATRAMELGGSLNASAAGGATATVSVSAYDSLGKEHTFAVEFQRAAAGTNSWTWRLTNGDAGLDLVTNAGVNTGDVNFSPDGSLASVTGGANGVPTAATLNGQKQARISIPVVPAGSANTLDIIVDFNQMTQPAIPGTTSSDVRVLTRDGNTMGTLDDFFIDKNGIVYGVFSNGERRAIAQVALANFGNPEGLLRTGGNAYSTTANSGLEQIGEPGTGGRGTVAASNLESSNVDLASEFTNMIVTQRAYQANSRIITASDELLQDLVNIKR